MTGKSHRVKLSPIIKNYSICTEKKNQNVLTSHFVKFLLALTGFILLTIAMPLETSI